MDWVAAFLSRVLWMARGLRDNPVMLMFSAPAVHTCVGSPSACCPILEDVIHWGSDHNGPELLPVGSDADGHGHPGVRGEDYASGSTGVWM